TNDLGMHYRLDGVARKVRAIATADPAAFDVLDGLRVSVAKLPMGWPGAANRVRIGALTERHGPVPWRPELVDRLVGATRIARGEAALLLAGLPFLDSTKANFMSAGQRAALGLTVAEARLGRDAWSYLSPWNRIVYLSFAMPADPERLWTDGPDVDAVA